MSEAVKTASIIAVGSEMLGTTRVDTNSLKITAALEDHGIALVRKSVAGDALDDLAAEIEFSISRADMLIMTGGLGPTEDDLTRDALAKAFGLEMEVDQSIIDKIEARFAARGWKAPEVNKRQANVFRGQTTLYNERGTAPGFHLQIVIPFHARQGGAVDGSEPGTHADDVRRLGAAAPAGWEPALRTPLSARQGGATDPERSEGEGAPGEGRASRTKHVFVFPGVPHELEWMIERYLSPWLDESSGGVSRHRRVLKIAGLTESGVEERLAPYYAAHAGEPVTILASPAGIEVHVITDAPEADARAFIAKREEELLGIFGDHVFGYDDETLEAVIGRMLAERGETLATAESCTGGLLSSRVTDVSGSSAYFLGGAVCYTGAAKCDLAGVDAQLIREHGEVSEPVAIALAQGIRKRFGSTYGAGITGIAGPTGGTPAKPVGTVYIAIASESAVEHRKLLWQGPRAIIKWYSTQQALDMLRRVMLRR